MKKVAIAHESTADPIVQTFLDPKLGFSDVSESPLSDGKRGFRSSLTSLLLLKRVSAASAVMGTVSASDICSDTVSIAITVYFARTGLDGLSLAGDWLAMHTGPVFAHLHHARRRRVYGRPIE